MMRALQWLAYLLVAAFIIASVLAGPVVEGDCDAPDCREDSQ